MSRSHEQTRRLCRIGVLAALYVPLSLFVAVQFGNVRISFGSLPVVVSALLFGPLESFFVAFIGEFFKQLLTYGFTATTVLYLIPPALRGLVIGTAAWALYRSPGQRLDQRRVLCYGVCMLAAVTTTTGNTLVNWLDSVLYGYYTPALIFGDALWRFAVGLINSLVIATVAMPLAKLLRAHGFADSRKAEAFINESGGSH